MAMMSSHGSVFVNERSGVFPRPGSVGEVQLP